MDTANTAYREDINGAVKSVDVRPQNGQGWDLSCGQRIVEIACECTKREAHRALAAARIVMISVTGCQKCT